MKNRRNLDREFEDFALGRTPALYRSAWLLCRDSHQAEDLVQETLAKVYARLHHPLGGRIDNLAAYAQTTLTRTFVSDRRKHANGELSFAEPPQEPISDATNTSDVRLILLRLLGELSPEDQAVVVLRYLEDLSAEETAQRLGTTSAAVRNRSMRALEKLRHIVDLGALTSPALSTSASTSMGRD